MGKAATRNGVATEKLLKLLKGRYRTPRYANALADLIASPYFTESGLKSFAPPRSPSSRLTASDESHPRSVQRCR